jgi:hypothetical protein
MDAPEPLRNAEEAQPIVPMHVAASSCEAAVDAKNLVLLEFPMPIKHTQVLQMSTLECGTSFRLQLYFPRSDLPLDKFAVPQALMLSASTSIYYVLDRLGKTKLWRC